MNDNENNLESFVYYLTAAIGNLKQDAAEKMVAIFVNAMSEHGYSLPETLEAYAAYCLTKRRMAETANCLERAANAAKQEQLLQQQTQRLMEDDSHD